MCAHLHAEAACGGVRWHCLRVLCADGCGCVHEGAAWVRKGVGADHIQAAAVRRCSTVMHVGVHACCGKRWGLILMGTEPMEQDSW